MYHTARIQIRNGAVGHRLKLEILTERKQYIFPALNLKIHTSRTGLFKDSDRKPCRRYS